MRIDCPHCLQKAVITSRNTLSTMVTDLYCQCINTADCGASFVFTLSYKHQLNPPIKTTQELAAALLKSLPLKERQALMQNVVQQNDLFN